MVILLLFRVNALKTYVREVNQPGGVLAGKGFKGRAEVVWNAVFDFLTGNGIRPSLDPKDVGRRER